MNTLRNDQGRFTKGNSGFWLGKKRGPHSPEWKQKMALAMSKRRLAPEHRRRIGEANKVKLLGRVLPAEVKYKISMFQRAHPRPTSYYRWIGSLSVLKQSQRKGFNSLEKILYAELDRLGVSYFKQYPIGQRYVVDAFVPKMNLAIEADGDYWHALEKNIRRDMEKDEYLLDAGFKVLRATESELRKDPTMLFGDVRLVCHE